MTGMRTVLTLLCLQGAHSAPANRRMVAGAVRPHADGRHSLSRNFSPRLQGQVQAIGGVSSR